MPIDFKSLHKLESLPGSASAQARSGSDRVEVLVKLRKGAKLPPFVTPRMRISSRIFSAEMLFDDLKRLEADPRIESMSLNRRVPYIK